MEIAGISIWLWAGFVGLIIGFLALDLGVFHRKAHEIGMREALIWSAIWIAVALAFGGVIYLGWQWIHPGSDYTNSEATLAYITGYLIEKSLSVDNIFVFLVVFTYFQVPRKYQHRVLFWGIVGALVFRGIFIALGAVVLSAFVWTMVVFGLFLILTGLKMLWAHGKSIDPGNNPVVRVFRRLMPTTEEYHGQRFFVRMNGVLHATPLFVALLVVEFTDVLFAVDSVPAIFAITQNPFIVFTSNVFAILGLRALFFAVSGLMQLFRFLHYGLAAILLFVGGKMIYNYLQKVVVPEWPHFPVVLSLLIIAGILTTSIVASILKPVRKPQEGAPNKVA
ncbi:MAG: TerC family protein [Fimbriimonadales bacterium]|nr:TerC family protein [Fimbriimonadales bacterium]